VPSFEKILEGFRDDVLTEGFRMRRVNVLLRIYLALDLYLDGPASNPPDPTGIRIE
jgi:hypothetical protein